MRDLPFDDVDERLVWLTLADLEKAQLLRDGSAFASNSYAPKNRRAFMKQLALGSAVAVPIVVGISLPTAAQAATCAGLGGSCANNVNCCENLSCSGQPDGSSLCCFKDDCG